MDRCRDRSLCVQRQAMPRGGPPLREPGLPPFLVHWFSSWNCSVLSQLRPVSRASGSSHGGEFLFLLGLEIMI